jgi:hypothetical protein
MAHCAPKGVHKTETGSHGGHGRDCNTAGDRREFVGRTLIRSLRAGLQRGSGMSTPFNIQQRTFNFAVTVVNFCRGLTAAHPVTRRVGWQLLDAATSIGANMEEADAAQSHRDFVAKAAIARKESRETVSGSD